MELRKTELQAQSGPNAPIFWVSFRRTQTKESAGPAIQHVHLRLQLLDYAAKSWEELTSMRGAMISFGGSVGLGFTEAPVRLGVRV